MQSNETSATAKELAARQLTEATGKFLARAWTFTEQTTDVHWQAKRELADMTHELVVAVSQTDAPAQTLQAIKATIEQQLATLQQYPQRSFKSAWRDGSYIEDPQQYSDRIWLVGGSNAAVPRLQLRRDDDTAIGEITFDESCVGAPGWAHGGMIAAVFDQTLGYRLITDGHPIVTGKLSIEFLSPTPLNEPIVVTANLVSQQDRRLTVEGQSHVGDRLTCRAQGVFIIVKPGQWKL